MGTLRFDLWKRRLVVGGAAAFIVFALGWNFGGTFMARREHVHSVALRAAQRERDAKITAWIVKINPRATIRDFGGDFPDFLVRVAEAKGIRFQLLMALIEKESAWDPEATGAKGEVGLMQMLPATAKLVAQRLGDKEFEPPVVGGRGYARLGSLARPRTAISYGLEYLDWKQREFDGMSPVALRAYNRNPRRARESWPNDRYAEEIAMTYVTLTHAIPSTERAQPDHPTHRIQRRRLHGP